MSIRWIALVTGMVGLVVTGAQALPDEIKAEYTTGSRPVAAAFSDSHRLGVVANADDNTLSLLDTAQAAGGLTSMAACTSPTAVEYADDAFVLACGGGLIERYSVSLGSFPASLSSLTDIQLTQTVDLIDLVISGDDAYPISDAGVVFHADLLTSAEDLDSYFPISLADDLVPGDDDDDDDSASTAAIAPVALAASADHLVVALDDGWLVDVTLGEETYTVAPVDTGALDLVTWSAPAPSTCCPAPAP